MSKVITTTVANFKEMTFVLVKIGDQQHRVFFADEREKDNFLAAMSQITSVTTASD